MSIVAQRLTDSNEFYQLGKIVDKIKLTLLPGLSLALLYMLSWTTRARFVGLTPEKLKREKCGTICAIWHGQLLMHAYYYKGTGINILVSASKDGEIAVRAVERIGFVPLRGSSSRGGQAALLKMIKALKAGNPVAVTPDGPRGPLESAQMGTIYLAKLTGARIIPMAFGASRKIRLKSWDRHIVPMPFSSLVFLSGPPITVRKNAGREEMDGVRRELEKELNRLSAKSGRDARG